MAGSLCDKCAGLCCRWIALPIDNPKTAKQFDDIRWYLAHENVHVFVEDDQWYLAVQTRCQFLRDDNKCGIYEDRPRICREYTTDNCDYHVGSYEFQQYFTTPEQIEAYAQAVLGERYTKYCMKQRRKNTGQEDAAPEEVLGRRRRPLIMGHPSGPQPGRFTPGGLPGGVALSIRGVKR